MPGQELNFKFTEKEREILRKFMDQHNEENRNKYGQSWGSQSPMTLRPFQIQRFGGENIKDYKDFEDYLRIGPRSALERITGPEFLF